MARANISAATRRRIVWAATIANAFEWFDFVVFGLLATIIAKNFFPQDDPTAGLLATYGLFSVAFVARPLGALFFGTWADRSGRKPALVAIVLSMAVGTGLIGAMPTYHMIGAAAPVGVLAARIVQGFSAGGDFGTATAMLAEFAPRNKRSFYASFQFVAQALSFVLAALLSLLLNLSLSSEAMETWGWRVPFLIGVTIGPVGLFLRRSIDETPAFQAFLQRRAGRANSPLRDVFASHWRSLISLFLILAGLTTSTYLGNVFLPNFAASRLGLKATDAQLGVVAVSFIAACVYPAAAIFCDRTGRRRVLAFSAAVYMVISLWLAASLVRDPTAPALWALQASGLITVFIGASFLGLSMDGFPVGVRSTGASLVYSFAVMTFGGIAPLATQYAIKVTGSDMAPFYYLALCLCLSVVGVTLLPPRDQSKGESAAITAEGPG
jgi:MFS family permease